MRVSVSKRRRPNGTRGTPERRQGVHTTPWQCTLCHACQAKGRRPNDTSGTPEGRHGIHPTPCQCTLCHACHTRGTPEGRQGVHPTPWQCTLCHLPMHVVQPLPRKAAETKWHQRDARGTSGRTSDPLPMHVVPRLPHLRDARGTPGRTSDPLAMHVVPLANARCATPATQKRRWQCMLCHACHAKAAGTSSGDQMAPEGRQRDARAYTRPLGNARCATPATQKRRRPNGTSGTPEGRQGVHPSPCKGGETKWHQREARIQKPQSSLSCRGVFSAGGSNFPGRRMSSSFPACFLHASDMAASGDSESK